MNQSMKALMMAATVLLAACVSIEQGVYDMGIQLMRNRCRMNLKHLSTPDRQIAYLERTGGTQTLLMVHGYTSNKDAWLRLARHIPPQYRIIAPDLPGHGDNDKDSEATYDAAHLAAGLAALVEGLDLRRFHLAGSSLGGAVSILYALENPGRVASLGLFATAGFESPQRSEFEKAVARGENPLVIESKTDFDRFVSLCFYDPPWMPWPIAAVMIREDQTHGRFYEKMLSDIMASPRLSPETVRRLQIPVFVLWGDKDRVLHPSTTEVIRQQLPRARIIIMKNCGHIPMMERPAETAEHYLTFLKNIDTR